MDAEMAAIRDAMKCEATLIGARLPIAPNKLVGGGRKSIYASGRAARGLIEWRLASARRLRPTCSSKLRRVGAGTYLTRSDDQKMMRGVGRFRSLRAWPSVVGRQDSASRLHRAGGGREHGGAPMLLVGLGGADDDASTTHCGMRLPLLCSSHGMRLEYPLLCSSTTHRHRQHSTTRQHRRHDGAATAFEKTSKSSKRPPPI